MNQNKRTEPLKYTGQMHDYTELVIELWDACSRRRPKLHLGILGSGDSRAGIDTVGCMALLWLKCTQRAEEKGWWWDGGWIEAVEEFAAQVSKVWAKRGVLEPDGVFESIASKVIKKHAEKPGS